MYGDEPDGQGQGPEEGRAYVELVGGPLDGLLLDVTGWPPQEVVDGALLMSDHGRFGPGGRSDYEPAGGGCGDVGRFVWRGDVP
ncbi:hypothetical protein ACIP46_37120 [Streptomyces lavendulae]|uniref:hypothetical protein n=1 Tax=Streptomyces lavendulae TaxID=1914 RepID=UPI00380A0146